MMAPPKASTPAPFPRTLRRNYARSKLGCLTCRQRKKKCDEIRPRCSGCNRNQLKCLWPITATNRNCDLRNESSNTELASLHEAGDPIAPIVWESSLGSFLRPTRSTLLTNTSRTLLQHYLESTVSHLFHGPGTSNPFVSTVLPLAYSDDLVMHSVLMMSGTHLCSGQQTTEPIEEATMYHYTCVLRSMRAALADVSRSDHSKVLRMLVVLALTAECESASSECKTGTLFPHLRASRQLILWLMEEGYEPATGEDRKVLGLILEIYSYLVLVNTITPYGLLESRTVPFDPFLQSLDFLSKYETFGMRFCGLHGLIQVISRVSEFAAWRLDEEQGRISTNIMAEYERLKSQITAWRRPRGCFADGREALQLDAIGEVYRNALLVALEAALAGSSVNDPITKARIENHVRLVAVHVAKGDLKHSQHKVILLWPVIIAGSCLRDESQRVYLKDRLNAADYHAWIPIRCSEVLELLWKDDDERAFGPYGLYFIMKKHGINLCLS